MKTSIYIDGFNLYYRAIKGTAYKWLDLKKLCVLLLASHHQITKIKYFTAHVSARPNDPGQPLRQQTYLRALRTLPDLEIILGHLLVNETILLKAGCPPDKPEYVRVVKTEEKGSDVNLAVHLVNDGYKGLYEAAVLITNDSDLSEAVRIVSQELRLPVGLLCPSPKASRTLQQYATFVKKIRAGVLAQSQFPPSLQDPHGTFHKPASW
jgi:uncharacterized LabA/DUF88 family protein